MNSSILETDYELFFNDTSPNPFSIYSFCLIKEGLIEFHSVHEYYIYHKYCTFDLSLKDIMNATRFLTMYRFFRRGGYFRFCLPPKHFHYRTWITLRTDIMKKGLKLKYDQSYSLRQQLLSTHHKDIYYAETITSQYIDLVPTEYHTVYYMIDSALYWGINRSFANVFGKVSCRKRLQEEKKIFCTNILGVLLCEIRQELQ